MGETHSSGEIENLLSSPMMGFNMSIFASTVGLSGPQSLVGRLGIGAMIMSQRHLFMDARNVTSPSTCTSRCTNSYTTRSSKDSSHVEIHLH